MYNIKFFHNLIIESLKDYNFWFKTAFTELKLKYRRTYLGQSWNILTVLITISILSLVWSKILGKKMEYFFPNLFFAYTSWIFISSMITTSTTLFASQHSNLIGNLKVNLFSIIIKNLTFNFFTYLHNVPIYLLILFFFNIDISLNSFLIILGYLLIIINYFWISVLIASLSARFRDLIPFCTSIMSVGMLLTPIIWEKDSLGQYQNFVYLNPLTFFIESIKYPFFGKNPGFFIYLYLFVLALIGFTITFLFLKKKYKYIVFWSV